MLTKNHLFDIKDCVMDTNLIKKLREKTNRGMLECKKALEANHGDYDLALAYLNKTYEVPITNDRVASKGLCNVVVKDNEAILYEVNAETDFVAKNNDFIKLVHDLGERLIDSDVNHVKSALKLDIFDTQIESHIKKISATIQEKINLRRFYRVVKQDEHSFGFYIHGGGKVVTLVILNRQNKTLARDLALQIAATSPSYISLSYIDHDTMNYEKFMYEKNHGSFDEKGFNKYLENITLYTQPFIYDDQKTVETILYEHHVQMIDFLRFELGQGIEDKLNCRLDIPCDRSKILIKPLY